VDRIKRLSFEVLDEYKSKFGEDFADNKKILDEVSIIRSKSLKNKITGYITRFIKKEIREDGLDKPSEGQIAVMFDHPRVVRTLGHGITTKGEQFIVM